MNYIKYYSQLLIKPLILWFLWYLIKLFLLFCIRKHFCKFSKAYLQEDLIEISFVKIKLINIFGLRWLTSSRCNAIFFRNTWKWWKIDGSNSLLLFLIGIRKISIQLNIKLNKLILEMELMQKFHWDIKKKKKLFQNDSDDSWKISL